MKGSRREARKKKKYKFFEGFRELSNIYVLLIRSQPHRLRRVKQRKKNEAEARETTNLHENGILALRRGKLELYGNVVFTECLNFLQMSLFRISVGIQQKNSERLESFSPLLFSVKDWKVLRLTLNGGSSESGTHPVHW